jgi:hypothetical protein
MRGLEVKCLGEDGAGTLAPLRCGMLCGRGIEDIVQRGGFHDHDVDGSGQGRLVQRQNIAHFRQRRVEAAQEGRHLASGLD